MRCTSLGLLIALLAAAAAYGPPVPDLFPDEKSAAADTSGIDAAAGTDAVTDGADAAEGADAAGDTDARPDLPRAGPESHGLRLRLQITQPADTRHATTVRVEIINVTTKPVTLEAAATTTTKELDYAKYLQAVVGFSTVPQVLTFSEPAVVSGAENESEKRQPPTATIAPGGTLGVTWDVFDYRIDRAEDYWRRPLRFPAEGLFSVRAHVSLRTAEGYDVRLYSNIQPFQVGAQASVPKACTAKVQQADPDTRRVTLDVRRADKIAVGDVFWIMGATDQLLTWRLDIVEVSTDYSIAEAKPTPASSSDGAAESDPVFPQAGWTAVLGVKP